MKKILVAVFAVIMCLALAGCGDSGSSGYGQGEQFQLEDNTYALEKTIRVNDEDTSTSYRYGVSLLQVGNTAPVVISGFGSDSMNTKSAIDMTLQDGDKTISSDSISFEATDEVEGYGSRVIFYFDIPLSGNMPTNAVLRGSNTEVTVDLDLSGLIAEEETTTTTTTTTAPSAEDLDSTPVDPNYDPEANQGVGDTEMYDAIDSFDVSLPDTDF